MKTLHALPTAVCLAGMSLVAACSGSGSDAPFVPPTGGGGGGGGGGGAANPAELLYAAVNPTAVIFDVDFSADGSTVVFVSNDNPVGQNIDGSQEIFAIDVVTGDVEQLTNEVMVTNALTLDLTADGSEVAFHSDRNYSGGNAALDPNVFLGMTDGSTFWQVTHVPAAFRPQVSGDGTLVVFSSDEDPFGINPAGDGHIYRINRDGSGLAQLTFGLLDPQWIRMSADGSRLVFQSDANPFGANNDGLNEIHVMNTDATGHMQITLSVSQGSVTPEISDDGELVAISSSADLIAGSNPGLDAQIFVLRADGTGTVQITDGDTGSSLPDISGDGEFVVFQSLADLTGDKPSATPNDPTIFWASTDGTALEQVLTDDRLDDPADFATSRLATSAETNGDGSQIVFVSPLNYTSDATGTRPKIYLIER